MTQYNDAGYVNHIDTADVLLPQTPDSDTKHWYESKTIWFNAIIGGLAFIAKYIDPALPTLEHFMTPENFAVLLATVSLINAVLRKYTSKAIKGVSQ